MAERRLSFDGVAETYDRARPGYPDALFEAIANRVAPPGPLLEIGPGTGRATRPLAARGFDVHAVEPGAELAGILRGHLADHPGCRVTSGTFEAATVPEGHYAAIVAAQSFHWVDPEVAYAKCARSLAPGGWIAVFGNTPRPGTGSLRSEIDAAYATHYRSPVSRGGSGWYRAEGSPFESALAAAGGFAPPVVAQFEHAQRYETTSYLELLGTHSDHLALSAERREALLGAIADAIDRHGGEIEVDYVATLFLAQRIDAEGSANP